MVIMSCKDQKHMRKRGRQLRVVELERRQRSCCTTGNNRRHQGETFAEGFGQWSAAGTIQPTTAWNPSDLFSINLSSHNQKPVPKGGEDWAIDVPTFAPWKSRPSLQGVPPQTRGDWPGGGGVLCPSIHRWSVSRCTSATVQQQEQHYTEPSGETKAFAHPRLSDSHLKPHSICM